MARDLFIGLGGTGGETLRLLYARMTEDQRRNANYIYIDTDQKSITDLQREGIKTIRISTANTVGEIAAGLGREDGVRDWLPWNEREGVFLNSSVDDGASQYRYKSRLCLARFLRDPNNELHRVLVRLTPPGAQLTTERVRVVIVSSIAGGTGAGTFIELALYIRAFFRDYGNNAVRITGVLGCPDLYTKLVSDKEGDDEDQRQSMYANAYAAIRELNAMNLATSAGATTNDYGKKIRIYVNTRSEGKLFDSVDPTFKSNTNAKPFDLIYFVDEANSQGGILSGISQYYAVMADITYSRLYSPLELAINSGESNELNNHISAPTAIYGSAGYARVRYPYEEILRYLAERKMQSEIDSRWRLFDDQWNAECEMELDLAAQEGRTWQPDKMLRGRRFMEQMDADMDSDEHSNFRFLRDMVLNGEGQSRVEDFLGAIDQAVDVGNVSDAQSDTVAPYSIRRDTAVQESLASIISACNGVNAAAGDDPISRLDTMAKNVANYWTEFCAALRGAISGQANRLYSAIFPTTKTMLENAQINRLPINLHWGLLCKDKGQNAVHPLAARYLLYSLRARLSDAVNGALGMPRGNFEEDLQAQGNAIRLAFDEEWDDGDDFTVEDEIGYLSRLWGRRKENVAKAALDKYREAVLSCVRGALDVATAEYKRVAYRKLMDPLNELIGQYERFFENLGHYQQQLEGAVRTDHVMHDNNNNQVIFVGASSAVKDYYFYDQPSVVAALESGSAACFSAEGAGVYGALEGRTLKALEGRRMRSRDALPRDPDRFDDMGGIFDAIIEKFQEHLRNNAAYLKTDAVGALVHEICAETHIDESKINSTASNRTIFREAFRKKMADLEAKAAPMIRYNQENSMKYFVGEEQDSRTDVSRVHRYYGISPKSAEGLARYFHSNGTADPLQEFKTFLGTMNVVSDSSFGDFEIFCFCAVHCLQPNQIYRFDELQDGSYYAHYKERVHEAIKTGLLSKSPHIDKRWHRKGAMPYISKKLEFQWRKEVMRAFIYQILTRKIRFTVDRDNRKCFLSRRDGVTKFIEWPAGWPVLTRNISRLVEYIAEDEITVERDAASLDEMVRGFIQRNSNYGDSAGLYKAGMTRDPLLSRMRTDALTFYRTAKGEAKMTDEERARALDIRHRLQRSRGESVAPEDEDEVVNLNASMGGILRIAYLLHMSEERLDEDQDFGEALIQAVQDIIDEYACGMYGLAHVSGDAVFHREYVEIYNWALDKFMGSWVEQASREIIRNPVVIEETDEEDDLERLLNGTVQTVSSVPAEVQATEEYGWISANLKYKSIQAP